MSLILYGSHGYIGSAFAEELNTRGEKWIVGRRDHAPSQLWEYIKPTVVVNCAGFIPSPSVAECDKHPDKNILGNVVFPVRLMDACLSLGFVFVQISTGCLWNDGLEHSEDDSPQRGFGGHCGTYIGSKIMVERIVSTMPKHYIFRVRLPFDEFDHHRNYLTKLAGYDEIYSQCNSVSHRGDFVKACMAIMDKLAPFGTYNVVNEGSLESSEIAERLMKSGIRKKPVTTILGPEGQCRLSIDKLKSAGVKMRTAWDAMSESIDRWKPNVQAPQ